MLASLPFNKAEQVFIRCRDEDGDRDCKNYQAGQCQRESTALKEEHKMDAHGKKPYQYNMVCFQKMLYNQKHPDKVYRVINIVLFE